jgi:CHAT domain-containing protein
MGYAPREATQWFLAVALGREAVSAVVLSGRPAEEAQARSRLATVAASAGMPAEAAAEFEKANRLYHQLPRSANVRAFEANGEIALAEIECDTGQYSLATSRLASLRPELPYLQSYTFPLRYYVTLGKLHLQRGDVNDAEADLHAAVAIAELGLRSLPDPLTRLTWERETGQVYRLLARLLLRERRNEVGALRVWEWYRSSAMRGHTPRLTPADMALTRSLPNEISFARLESNPALPPINEFDKSRANLQNLTVISYAWLSDGLAIWVFDNRSVHSQWVAVPKASLERVARRFAENCAGASTSIDDIHRDGAQLYAWLVQPVIGMLRSDNVLVIQPDGPIAMVPFQAMWTSGSEYLGARWAIMVSPGINFARKHERSQSPMSLDGALVVGVSNVTGVSGRGLPAIHDVDIETEMVARHFNQKTVLLGNQATRDAILRQLPRARVFHFAGHALSGALHRGLLLPGSETAARNQDAVLLDPDTIGHISMSQCRLAVLSACSTGSAEDVIVDPADLASAFLRSGVLNVVASRWNVDSAATRVFMSSFYSRLIDKRNATKGSAKCGCEDQK